MRSLLLPLGLALALGAAAPAAAQVPSNRVSGTIAAFDGTKLTVKAADGSSTTVTLPADVKVGAVVDRTLDDIKAGDFVGSAAVEGPDGKLHAQEVHIFPEPMRGTGEGHRPMSMPKQTMTNATVATVAKAPQGRVLQLSYKGGTQEIEVDPGTRIVLLVPGDRSLLKPGAAVAVFVSKGADGSLTARAVQAEKDGVKPLW
ncbi:hypothetical protein [Labrys wisconsinensis]|uniref:DUF5666 domain-containing protein n=1 Tax=Labrys wisconsinensis TaxID=425677 RepID=A0ABU0JF45_9HYPH|nr:hypothetical protein [Labrys wisconsinensis]MDQ0472898.1 hypothetical protein [Labrys wisconsinensis]